MPIDNFLLSILACPYDGGKLFLAHGDLACECGRRYPIVEGIPVLLRDDVNQTHGAADRSLAAARAGAAGGEAADEGNPAQRERKIEEHVQASVAATNGIMYRGLIGKLKDYPIPTLNLPAGHGRVFLDIGCNWGRWCIAAARRGFTAIGIDPALGALQAAQRVAAQLGTQARFVCGDGRYLPFHEAAFDVVYSYSVLQHFSKADVATCLSEVRRVLRSPGTAVVQMPNVFGLRSLYHQARRGFKPGSEFDVRYWTPSELRSRFTETIGPTRLSVDGFFSLNPQAAEKHLLPARYRAVVNVSDALRAASRSVGVLTYVADSLIVTSQKGRADTESSS